MRRQRLLAQLRAGRKGTPDDLLPQPAQRVVGRGPGRREAPEGGAFDWPAFESGIDGSVLSF
jgi:hypothetical protein